MDKIKTGVELIAEERQEQIEKHGRTVESDVRLNTHCQLISAAETLMIDDYNSEFSGYDIEDYILKEIPIDWDKAIWRKMLLKPYKERLIIAGALIAAEIDRLQYQTENLKHG